MSQPAEAGATRAPTPPPEPKDASTGQLIGGLTEQVTTLVRSEVRLAQAEVTQMAKPPLPTETIASLQADVETVKQGISR